MSHGTFVREDTDRDWRIDTVERATALLELLGATADDVARKLIRLDVTGTHCDCHNPVGVFLERRLDATVLVETLAVALRRPEWDPGADVDAVPVRMPAPVVEFVRRFGLGEWPALERAA